MSTTRGRLSAVLALFLAGFLVVSIAPVARSSAEVPQWDEWDFLNLVNRERYGAGLPPLGMSPNARNVARAWSGRMTESGDLAHNPNFSGQIAQVIPNWRRAGENVGVGGGVSSLHRAFMNSSGHRANILGDWQWAGVGVRWQDGTLWVTVNFVKTSGGTAWETRTPLARLVGASASDSSVLVSRRLPAGSAAGVVVARSDRFPDALAGGPLAYVHQGSVLLTPPEAVPSNLVEEMRRVLAPGGRVMILGGLNAVSAENEITLRASGFLVERISGTDRYGTAAAVAPRVAARPDRAFIVSGHSFPDAVSASSPAAIGSDPILLVGPNAVPPVTSAWLDLHASTSRTVVGGRSAVSDAVYSAVGAKQRVAGADRYATSVNVANTFFKDTNRVTVAPGGGFADALAAAPDAARLGAPLVLTAPRPTDPSYGYVGTQAKRWATATVVGNTTRIPDTALQFLFT